MAEQPRKLIDHPAIRQMAESYLARAARKASEFSVAATALSDAVENAFRSLPRPPAPTQQAEGAAVGLTQSPPSATGGTDG